MLYKILRVLMTYALNFYFRRIEISGKDHIPRKGPIIFACNHPSSFMEAILLACFQHRTMHFLVRGDVFRIKWLKGLLVKTNQIPIYRFRDGFKNLKQNKKTFAKAHEILDNNGAIIIYAEGSTELTKKLRNLQRGMAKMAFGAWEEGNVENIQVVPVGVNYMDVLSWRSDVMIEVGQPIFLENYLKFYEVNPIECIRQLTQDTYEAMRPLIIHFNHYVDGHNLLLSDAVRKKIAPADRTFLHQKKISQLAEDSSPDIDYVFFNQHYVYWASDLSLLTRLLIFVITLLPASVGMLVIFPIGKLGDWITTKNKLSDEFIAPAKVAIFLVLGLLIWIASMLAALFIPSIIFSVIAIGLPLWMMCAGYAKTQWDYFQGKKDHELIEKKLSELYSQLNLK